jgi:hypothetical protein
MSIESIRAAARTRVLSPAELSQLRGQDPYGRVSSQVQAHQKRIAQAISISSPNKGGASSPPVNYFPTQRGIFGDILSGIGDFFSGGDAAAIAGGIADTAAAFNGGTPVGIDTSGMGTVPTSACPIPGQRVDPVTGECRFFMGVQSGPDTGGQAVVGSFGLPAMVPAIVGQINGKPVRRCRKGSVLGTDELCYSKAVLPPRSKFRKWKRPPRPALSRRDEVAIRRAAGAKDRVLNLAREAGLHASLTKPKARARAPQHHHHPNGSN